MPCLNEADTLEVCVRKAARALLEHGINVLSTVNIQHVASQHETVRLLAGVTVTETLPGYTLVTWYGVMAPRGTPARIIQTINAEVNRILQTSEMKKFFDVQGMAPTGGTVANFNDRIRTDNARWVKVVKEAGLMIN